MAPELEVMVVVLAEEVALELVVALVQEVLAVLVVALVLAVVEVVEEQVVCVHKSNI